MGPARACHSSYGPGGVMARPGRGRAVWKQAARYGPKRTQNAQTDALQGAGQPAGNLYLILIYIILLEGRKEGRNGPFFVAVMVVMDVMGFMCLTGDCELAGVLGVLKNTKAFSKNARVLSKNAERSPRTPRAFSRTREHVTNV